MQDLASGKRDVADFTIFLKVSMAVGKTLDGIDCLDNIRELNAVEQPWLGCQQSNDVVRSLPAFQSRLTQDHPQTTLQHL